MKTLPKILFILTFLSLISILDVYAQTKGQITGKITDEETKEPLPGVNVMIKGTYYGAATDLQGNYTIRSMNPGQYTMEISMIGYKKTQNTGVRVLADQTTKVDVELEVSVLAFGEEVVIIGERPLFDIEETASRRSISSSEIQAEVVESVQDIEAKYGAQLRLIEWGFTILFTIEYTARILSSPKPLKPKVQT